MKHILFYLTLVKAMLGVAISSHSAEPLDMAILMPRPVSAKPCEPLDLRILAVPVEARAVEALDLSILSDAPKPVAVAKPAVKPAETIIDYVPPGKPSSIWSHPGSIKQHLREGVHRGTLTEQQLSMLSDSEAEVIHSLQHERKPATPIAMERLVASVTAPAAKRRTSVSPFDGLPRYEHSDGVYRFKPEPGACYCGANCRCGDACPGGNCPATKHATMVAPQPVYQQSGCPGGVCPTRQSRPARRGLFR